MFAFAFADIENSYIYSLEYDGACFEYAADVLLYRPGKITLNGLRGNCPKDNERSRMKK